MEVVAAAVGIADVTARSAHMLWRLCDAWRDAPHDVFQLRDDLSRANEFYDSLKDDAKRYSSVRPSVQIINPRDSETLSGSSLPDEAPPPWSPPNREVRDSHSDGNPIDGKLGTLLELVQTGTRVLEELEGVIGMVMAGRVDGQDASQHRIGSRRRMIWMIKAKRVKKLRVEMTTNMLMVSGALVAINASTTSQIADSVAILSYKAESQHHDLKHTVLETAGALTTIIDATAAENKLTFKRLEDRLDNLHLTSKGFPFTSSSVPMDFNSKPVERLKNSQLAGLLYCDGCTCRCHSFRTRSSWSLRGLEKTFGHLNISAGRLRLNNLTCNKTSCSQFGKDGWYMVTYRVPLWLCSTTVRLFCSFSTPSGFDFCLRMGRHLEPGAKNSKGTIFYYIQREDLEGVKRMLASQPQSVLDYMGVWQHTPLAFALQDSFVEAVLLLLQAGADPFANDRYSMSPFDYIFSGWLSNQKSALTLMKSDLVRPIFFEYMEQYDFSDLQQAIIGVKPLDIPTVMAIPQMASQANATKARRMSPLCLAVVKGDGAWVKALLKMGANPNEPVNSDSDNALFDAAWYCRLDIARALLEAGADVHSKSRAGGGTALHFVAAFDLEGSREVAAEAADLVDLLIAYGAEVDAVDSYGRTPLLKCNLKTPLVGQRLIRHGANVCHESSACGNALTTCIMMRSPETMRMLLQEGADWRFTTTQDYTILHALAFAGTAEMIRFCREWKMRGLDVNAKDVDGMTPLDLLEDRHNVSDEVRREFMRLLEDQALKLEEVPREELLKPEFDSDSSEDEFFDFEDYDDKGG